MKGMEKLTAETITSQQIRDAFAAKLIDRMTMDNATNGMLDGSRLRTEARQRCADAINNARAQQDGPS